MNNRQVYKLIIAILCYSFSFIQNSNAQEQGIIINEFSNGANGVKEYIEFLVVGCSGSRVDIRGWKFDDNNGDFSNGPIGSAGIASGHSRFSMDVNWSSVPVGAIILVYNNNDKNPSILIPDDPVDFNVDSVYVLSHGNSTLIQTCDLTPATGNSSYASCTLFGPGQWTTVGMRNQGDATQVRRPDGSYFHGFGWGDATSNNTGGPDNLFFSGQGGTRVYSYTSPSCNYRDITNFTSLAAPAGETPGLPNNSTNDNYIQFLRTGITPGIILGNQTICTGTTPNSLTEFGSVIRCYVNYQWQSSTTGIVGSFSNLTNVTDVTFSPPSLTATTFYRRVVTNSCQNDTSNIITIAVSPNTSRADPPVTSITQLCVNASNSSFTTNSVFNATSYIWELFPPHSGTITETNTTASVDWNDSYSGISKVVVKANGCGGGQPSDTLFISIFNAQAAAGNDQLGICSTTLSTTLSAASGNGSWSILSGLGGSVSDISLYNANFFGLSGETYELHWTIPASVCANAGSDQVILSFNESPNPPIAADIESCVPGQFILSASGGAVGEYRWYTNVGIPINGETLSNYQTPLLLSSSSYQVALSNGSCESSRTPISIIIQNSIQIDAGEDINTISGKSVSLNGTANSQFGWVANNSLSNPGVLDPIVTPRETTTYILTSTIGGCTERDSVTVFVLCDQFQLPNLITPNGDNKNDQFDIGCTTLLNWNLEIANRWGDLIYQNSNYQNEWKAEGLSNGVYFFYLYSEVLNVTYKGWIEVLN